MSHGDTMTGLIQPHAQTIRHVRPDPLCVTGSTTTCQIHQTTEVALHASDVENKAT